jgi:hypothetical protein
MIETFDPNEADRKAENAMRRDRARKAMEHALSMHDCHPDRIGEALEMVELDTLPCEGPSDSSARYAGADAIAVELLRVHHHLTTFGQAQGRVAPYGRHAKRSFSYKPPLSPEERERVEDELIRTGRYIGF